MRRVTTRELSLLAVALLALSLLWPQPARSTTPIDAVDVVTLRELAGSTVAFAAGHFERGKVFHTATATYPFTLPADAVPATPDEAWFLLELDYEIVFAPDSAAGFVWVSADTNGLTAAQLEYELRRDAGGLTIRESAVTLQDGQLERTLAAPRADVAYVNYARAEGMTVGRNTLTLRVEHTDGVALERVRFDETSGVSLTRVSPEPLALDATLGEGELRVGERFSLTVRAENRRDRALGPVAITVEPGPGFARPIGATTQRVDELAGTAEHVFRFEALRAGLGQITVLASTAGYDPATVVDLFALPRRTGGAARLVLVALAATAPLALGTLAVLARSRLRRSRHATPEP